MVNQTISVNRKEDCSGCRACEKTCPKKAIIMREDDEGFLYPYIEENKCNLCGNCMAICKRKIRNNIKKEEVDCYAAYAENDAIRNNSTSGGVFPLIAEEFVKNGGVVYGAAYKDIYSVIHTHASNLSEIKKLLGSKYIQSDVNDSYCEVEEYLENGYRVLFSGTPCQISGLKKYLKREFDELYCVSLICHGVPSPKVWKRYVDETVRDYKMSEAKSACFRKKRGSCQFFELYGESWSLGWNWTDSTFIHGFLNELYLRPSCYNCKEKGIDMGADIVIGDFWGIGHFDKSMSDINSVSACIIISEKGRTLFSQIQGLETEKCSYADIVYDNKTLEESSYVDQRVRSCFFSNFLEKEYSLSKCILETEKYAKTIKRKNANMPDRFRNKGNTWKTVLWGTGQCYRDNVDKIKSIISVDYVCDNNTDNLTKKTEGLNIILPEDVGKLDNPFVIIMIENPTAGFQVVQQLLDMGVMDFDLFDNWKNYAEDFVRVSKNGN